MLKVAITGNIGSGKTTVTHFFKLLGISVFSADASGHKVLLYPYVISALKNIFGNVVFDASGIPDRKKIGEIVFSDFEKLKALNHIVHPVIQQDMLLWFEQQKNAPYYILCEAAVLFEAHFEIFFDKIITVSAPEELRIHRIESRDKISRQLALQKIHSQLDEKIKIEKSDFLIVNDDVQSVIYQSIAIHKKIIDEVL